MTLLFYLLGVLVCGFYLIRKSKVDKTTDPLKKKEIESTIMLYSVGSWLSFVYFFYKLEN